MPELPASTPRHLVHGAAGAFTVATGLPTDFRFTYGTWTCPDTGDLAVFGVITDYSVSSIGDIENLRDGAGNTMAHVIKDPGWEITASILVAKTLSPGGTAPRRMAPIIFKQKLDNAPGDIWVDTQAVVTSVSQKWSREGWTMLEVKAESRDALNREDVVKYGVSITETSAVEEQIYIPD